MLLAAACFAIAELALVQPLAWVLEATGSTVRAPVWDVLRAISWSISLVLAIVGVVWARNLEAPEPEGDWRPDWLWGALNDLTEGIVAFGSDGRVVFANDAACRHLQRAALPTGTPMMAFSDVPRLRTSLVKALRERETVHTELTGPNQTVLVAQCTPAADDGALLLVLDVTEQRRVIEAREAFLSDSAHELRTPVAALLAGSEALEMTEQQPRTRRMVESMVRNASRLRALIDDLLTLNRLQAGATRIDLAPARVRAVAEQALERISAPVDRVTLVGDEDLACIADEVGLERVLANLVQNALRYTPGRVEVRWEADDEGVTIRVDDEGDGIPPERREDVFDRFYRLDHGRSREKGGTGLGLSIVQELVRRFGGSIHIEDAAELGGASFVVQLAVEEPDAEANPVNLPADAP